MSWPLVPAVALPVLFLHVRYQPNVDLDLGSTTAGIELSDVAVLAVVLAAAAAGVRLGWEPLRAGRRLWLLGGLFLALVLASTVTSLARQEDYAFLTHLITAATFCEYALLAPALPLLLRTWEDSLPLLWSLTGVSALASGWGLLQFAGLVDEFEGRRPLQREPSFVGIHDFAALSGAAFVLALALVVLGMSRRERPLAAAAGVAGSVGLVLSGAVTGVLGVALAALAVLGVARARVGVDAVRVAAVVVCVAFVAAGVPLMRSGEVPRVIRELGIGSAPRDDGSVDSYVHRSLLAYVGARIFLAHPVLGVGWQGSQEPENYGPYLDDAHRRYPDVPDVAFPSPAHSWGIQNAYLQTLADLGLVGFGALVALFVAALLLGLRACLRAPPQAVPFVLTGTLWLLVAAGVWNGVGLVAGIPLDALTWLGLGLIAAAAAWTADARA